MRLLKTKHGVQGLACQSKCSDVIEKLRKNSNLRNSFHTSPECSPTISGFMNVLMLPS